MDTTSSVKFTIKHIEALLVNVLMSCSMRTGLYSTILSLSVLQTGVALTGAVFHRDTNRRPWVTQTIFESFTTFFAVVTTVWTCILLCNNTKPHSKHLFARFITHIYSLGMLTIIWLVAV
ncbi:uncharacterized protein EV420DRAFT_478649 [Desarmillaria tabescens]|uniref:MARVEL domain-containing protein n=1 Tax=Armillaria tabescens TaxID=1929756 RepID=A0AA39KAW5_ARMTA|nr:uncharacterized protein EV420DRAFT_478649 [Desarmillaria tabescens]KAK0457791.1 hypothetical protein EV420DRAFT_478649 [Desarmillaria tabescens]